MIEPSKFYLIGWFGSIFGSISLISTLLVIIIYCSFKEIRTFTFRMVLYLQISDFLLSISIIMIAIGNFSIEVTSKFCQAQAIILNFGVLSTTVWTFLITLIMLQSLKYNLHSLKTYEKYYVIFGFSFPLILTVIPIGLGYFEAAGYWCWVNEDNSAFFVLFSYGIVIFVLIFNAIGVFIVLRYMKKLESLHIIHKTSILVKLRFYPLILALLWIFPIINRFAPYFFHYNPVWTSLAHIICESIVGFSNMLLLALTPKARNILREKICRKKNIQLMNNVLIDSSTVEKNDKNRASTGVPAVAVE